MQVFQCDRCKGLDTDSKSYRNQKYHAATITICKETDNDDERDEFSKRLELCANCNREFESFITTTNLG